MKKDIAKKWINALRSGKYKQTDKILAKENNAGTRISYCCLGVLCDLYVKENPKKLDDVWFDDAHLPNIVRTWASMKSNNGTYPSTRFTADHDGYFRDLTMDNDTAHRRFKQIAKIIEKHMDEL